MTNGIPDTLRFRKCNRGFVLVNDTAYLRGDMPSELYAFDRIEDVAAWLMKNFAEPISNADR